jgi:hypothetical protein
MKDQLVNDLVKVMGENFINYRNCAVEVLVGGWRWNNQKFTKLSDLDEAITQSINAISNSIKKGSTSATP